MVALGEDIEKRSFDEAQMRRGLVFAYFPYMYADQWKGMTQEDLVGFVETLHQRLAALGPQQLRDPKILEELKAEYRDELPVLGKEIEGAGMSAYDLLLHIAEGQENFSPPPLSAHRKVPKS